MPVLLLPLPVRPALPLFGPILFGQDVLIYASFLLLAAVGYFLYRTHAGLVLRSVGDSHEAAHAIGYRVIGVRYLATLFGGALSGVRGAHLSPALSPGLSA